MQKKVVCIATGEVRPWDTSLVARSLRRCRDMSARGKRDLDLAMGVAQSLAFVILAAVFFPPVRRMVVSLGLVAVVVIAVVVLTVAIIALLHRSGNETRDPAPGSVILSSTPPALPTIAKTKPLETTEELIEQLRKVDWFQFEKIVGLAYQRLGYVVTCRGGANPDGGIDLIIEMAGEKCAVQCKHWKTREVGEPAMRDFLGALTNAEIPKGIFITLNGYTGYAKQFAENNEIELMNVTGLAKLLESTNARIDPEVLEILNDQRKFCPKCGAEMKLRTARKGLRPGQQFWGCSNYGPRGCQGKLPYQPRHQATASVAVLCFALFLQGCERRATESAAKSLPVGQANETGKFWDALNQAAVAGDGVEVLQKSSWQGKVSDEDMANVFRDISLAERERCQKIESLGVLHVDPELAAYAVQFVQTRTEIANFLSDGAEALDQEKTITSGSDFAVGFALQLLKHHNDDDGLVWNAFMDQAAQTASDLQQMKPLAEKMQARAASVRASYAALKTEEMGVRVGLAQRFNREFPPIESYAASKPPVKSETLSEKQIVRDMIGCKIDGWTFEAPDEFVSLAVKDVARPTDVECVYQVQTHVKGLFSGAEHDFQLRLNYGKLFTRWKLTGIQQIK